MNKLEQLSTENKDNYITYLRRMTESMKYSTKGLIPLLAKSGSNILDVGCGSGVMLQALENENESATLTGLDLNIDAIERLRENTNWKLYHMDFMELSNVKFDTIIFSSILHEISSYNSDVNKRFTEVPILEALNKCNELLDDEGSIIIRDGLLLPSNDRVVISFINPEDGLWLYRFQRDFRGFDNLNIDTRIICLSDNKFLVSEGFLKEFLCTYTWGEESYPREINERFGILTKNEWLTIIKKAGFKIETVIEAKEEYEKYLSPKVSILTLGGSPYEYPNITITVKAKKYTR
jgi:SAM-dependent methyltransferase